MKELNSSPRQKERIYYFGQSVLCNSINNIKIHFTCQMFIFLLISKSTQFFERHCGSKVFASTNALCRLHCLALLGDGLSIEQGNMIMLLSPLCSSLLLLPSFFCFQLLEI